jgi:hypothetical protein
VSVRQPRRATRQVRTRMGGVEDDDFVRLHEIIVAGSGRGIARRDGKNCRQKRATISS